jgi:hypothetical protein
MALIAALVAGRGVTRMLFDCRKAARDPAQERRLAELIAEAGRNTPSWPAHGSGLHPTRGQVPAGHPRLAVEHTKKTWPAGLRRP